VFDKQRTADAAVHTNPFPAIFQEFVEKARDWRLTVVGHTAFEVAISTDEGAKNDWRRHQLTSDVTICMETPPEGATDRCLSFLSRARLRFGAFDLIEDPDGRMVFLEVNPNGQFLWLENQLGLPISAAIAAELMRTAKS